MSEELTSTAYQSLFSALPWAASVFPGRCMPCSSFCHWGNCCLLQPLQVSILHIRFMIPGKTHGFLLTLWGGGIMKHNWGKSRHFRDRGYEYWVSREGCQHWNTGRAKAARSEEAKSKLQKPGSCKCMQSFPAILMNACSLDFLW